MLVRRSFLAAVGATLASPYILRSTAMAQQPRVRRDVMDLRDNDPFFAKYAEAVKAMHAEPAGSGRNWISQARIHADYCQHGDIPFLYWHRFYLFYFESICGELIGDPTFALPYWNWTKRSGILPNPFYDIPQLNVQYWKDPGKYVGKAWGPVDSVPTRGLQRGQGLQDDPARGGAFTQKNIDFIMQLDNAASFRSSLEGSPHNSGHVVSGGTSGGLPGHMGDGLSPLDPIFWLHHGMVDQMWAAWQARGNKTPDPGQTYTGFFDAAGKPVEAKSGAATNIADLGYTYDTLPSAEMNVASALELSGAVSRDVLLQGLARSETRVMGSVERVGQASSGLETAVRVALPGLGETQNSARLFRLDEGTNDGISISERRLLANFSNVMRPEGNTNLVVNVFVNCPYLDANTSYRDPYYAGTFSFFGRMAGMSHGEDFLVDITDPVRRLREEGKIEGNQLTVQLMPIGLSADSPLTGTTFNAGQLEIISM